MENTTKENQIVESIIETSVVAIVGIMQGNMQGNCSGQFYAIEDVVKNTRIIIDYIKNKGDNKWKKIKLKD